MKTDVSLILEGLRQHPEGEIVEWLAQQLISSGYECCLVGGSVRDFLLKLVPHDLDLVTNATPEQIELLFPDALPVGKQFGVMRLKHPRLAQGKTIEVATFREEDAHFDGRRPEKIIWSDLKNDALRRDFTINALYFNLQTHQLTDLVGGRKDLEKKCIRSIGVPEKRFLEDHLRILRAIRFSVHFGFEVEQRTKAAILKQAPLLMKLSRERITEELQKIISKKREDSLKALDFYRILSILFPRMQGSWKWILKIQNLSWLEFLCVWSLNFSWSRFSENEWGENFPYLVLTKDQKKRIQEFVEFSYLLKKTTYDFAQGFLFLKKKKFQFPYFLLEFINDKIVYNNYLELNHFIKSRSFDDEAIPIPFLEGSKLKNLNFPENRIQKILDEIYLEQLRGKIQTEEEALKKAFLFLRSAE